MASPAQPTSRAPPATKEIFLPDTLLEGIFLRLDTAADLARASTACPSFRRVIASASFLRRFRSLHPPPLLGFLYEGFHPAEPTHPSAPAARALAQAADFDFSFLPPPRFWKPRDSRDGRVLVARLPVGIVSRLFGLEAGALETGDYDDLWRSVPLDYMSVIMDLAVCDPLSRRYVILPRIHDDLAALGVQGRPVDFETFFAPTGEDEKMEEALFRVVARVQYKNKMLCFVFSSHSGQWHGFEFDSWSTLVVPGTSSSYGTDCLGRRYYAHGCFYWMLNWMDKLLILDTRKMEFCTTGISRGEYGHSIAISEAEEDMVGFFNIRRESSGALHLCYTIRGIKSEGANGLQLDLDKTIPLPLHYHYDITGAAEGYLILLRCPLDWSGASLRDRPENEYFSLELKTLQLARVCTSKSLIIHPVIYTGFPPSLSPSSM